MNNIAGIKFPYSLKIYEYLWGNENLSPRDVVVVETSQGIELGEIVYIGKKAPSEEMDRVMRVATESDLKKRDFLEEKSKDYYPDFVAKIKRYNLKMSPISCSSSLDESKITFFFTADGRVDFRELARDLSRTFQKQAILRQVGPRDQAKIVGGYGRCGRQICCASFLWGQDGVSMEKVEAQFGAPKNASKISGVCGRLMCCLNYEEPEKKKREARK
jgi:cell fate regulator YaaT (PSP1 superfamily)